MIVFIFHGLPYKSDRFFDLSGSLTHCLVIGASLIINENQKSPRQIFISICSIIWLVRLGTFLYLRIEKDGKDVRQDQYKVNRLTWTTPWFVQAVWVILIQSPCLIINQKEDPVSEYKVKDWVSLSVFGVLWIIGFLIECQADNEKFIFKVRASNKGKFINSGIWKYSRHPNYFGEILMWWCMCLIVIFYDFKDNQVYGSLSAPLFTMLLLCGVSGIPMLTEIGKKRWGHIKEYNDYI